MDKVRHAYTVTFTEFMEALVALHLAPPTWRSEGSKYFITSREFIGRMSSTMEPNQFQYSDVPVLLSLLGIQKPLEMVLENENAAVLLSYIVNLFILAKTAEGQLDAAACLESMNASACVNSNLPSNTTAAPPISQQTTPATLSPTQRTRVIEFDGEEVELPVELSGEFVDLLKNMSDELLRATGLEGEQLDSLRSELKKHKSVPAVLKSFAKHGVNLESALDKVKTSFAQKIQRGQVNMANIRQDVAHILEDLSFD